MKKMALMLALALWSCSTLAAKILVLGDSLSAAYGLRSEQGWVHLLQQNLGKTHQVINASQSGETSAGGLTRLPHLLKTHRPDWLILALGGNDGLRGLPPANLAQNLREMEKLAHAAKTRVLLVGIKLPPNYGARYIGEFEAVFADLAREKSLPFVPFLLEGFASDTRLFQADGIHPTAAAQPKMRDTVLKVLQPHLR